MNLAGFGKNKSGELVKTPQGYWAFNPHPLPPKLTPTWELAVEVSAADRALSELAGVARTLPNPHLLISPFIRREAVLSSRIEGTQASLSDLFFFEASRSARPSQDIKEITNYIRALEYGLERLVDLPISTRLFREMHERLMAGVRGDHLTPGEIRRGVQNWIGPDGCSLNEATYVPPPVVEMNAAMGDLERFINSRSQLPPLVRMALVHYQFEAIHPFLDGNGRIGRLLLTLLLCSEKLLPQPLLYLSAYFERYRTQYYDGLLQVSQQGRWMKWIVFFLRGITVQSRDAIKRSALLMDLQKRYRDILFAQRTSAMVQQLMESLFSYPAITTAQATERLKCTTRTAQLTIDKLVEHGILTEATGRPRNRVYMAQDVARIVEAPEAEIEANDAILR